MDQFDFSVCCGWDNDLRVCAGGSVEKNRVRRSGPGSWRTQQTMAGSGLRGGRIVGAEIGGGNFIGVQYAGQELVVRRQRGWCPTGGVETASNLAYRTLDRIGVGVVTGVRDGGGEVEVHIELCPAAALSHAVVVVGARKHDVAAIVEPRADGQAFPLLRHPVADFGQGVGAEVEEEGAK